jgi:diguanylate cyclase (GGDEF)-like protein
MSRQRSFRRILGQDQEDLRGFSHSIAELEWLLLVLVLLYFIISYALIVDQLRFVVAMIAYAAFVVSFRFLKLFKRETRMKLAIETGVMIAFITWVLWHTGKLESPLLNLYLLVIVTSALTLGKVITLLEFGLITSCYLYMGYAALSMKMFSFAAFTHIMIKFSPFLLAAYVTTILSDDIRHKHQSIKRLAETDAMTELLNMRAFNSVLQREFQKSERYAGEFSVMMIDLDNLKQVNDRFGHETGNQLIKSTAHTIQDCLRSADAVARYGGDEFIALLSDTDGTHTSVAAERIRMAIYDKSPEIFGDQFKSTVSIGIASYPNDAFNIENLLENADKALYKSKRNGRNRVTVYNGGR